ncbi:hypothetical protein C1T17_18020 [Sphingobium sp. SCG-1]|uniref:hypothetical protein n=1 Tax=Sphingobium sp. SCG-1 TaxID=2072936 RepID=UPI000CD6972F|nr:hypothetical protein [Sphingobium sp. SCG-1]AUW59698.1 hypothetical protein C1T17_18020 [Sphingobium sp. SCG-1]
MIGEDRLRWFGGKAQRLIQPAVQIASEPFGERSAWSGGDLLYALEPQLAQSINGNGIQSERRDRQQRHRLAMLARQDGRWSAGRHMLRDGMRTARLLATAICTPRSKAATRRGRSLRSARSLSNRCAQPVMAIQVPSGGSGETIGVRIGIDDVQISAKHPRLRDRRARHDAKPARCLIDRRDDAPHMVGHCRHQRQL